MKTLLITILLVASTTAIAEDNCKMLSSAAGSIMEARQAGVLMSDVMDIVTAHDVEALNVLIMMAYEEPQWSMEQNRRRAVTEFENDVMLECLKAANRRTPL